MKIRLCRSAVGAFTLVEKLIAIALVTILSASFFAGLGFSFSTVQRAREDARANQIMVEKMEALRLYSWSQLNTPGFVPQGFVASYDGTSNGSGISYQGTFMIASNAPGYNPLDASYSNELRFVTLELRWRSGKVNQTRRMSTLVTREGLQNYIY
jgi:type II secretory pathway pseudopilin PulG